MFSCWECKVWQTKAPPQVYLKIRTIKVLFQITAGKAKEMFVAVQFPQVPKSTVHRGTPPPKKSPVKQPSRNVGGDPSPTSPSKSGKQIMRADQTQISYPLTALGKYLGGFSRRGGKPLLDSTKMMDGDMARVAEPVESHNDKALAFFFWDEGFTIKCGL